MLFRYLLATVSLLSLGSSSDSKSKGNEELNSVDLNPPKQIPNSVDLNPPKQIPDSVDLNPPKQIPNSVDLNAQKPKHSIDFSDKRVRTPNRPKRVATTTVNVRDILRQSSTSNTATSGGNIDEKIYRKSTKDKLKPSKKLLSGLTEYENETERDLSFFVEETEKNITQKKPTEHSKKKITKKPNKKAIITEERSNLSGSISSLEDFKIKITESNLPQTTTSKFSVSQSLKRFGSLLPRPRTCAKVVGYTGLTLIFFGGAYYLYDPEGARWLLTNIPGGLTVGNYIHSGYTIATDGFKLCGKEIYKLSLIARLWGKVAIPKKLI